MLHANFTVSSYPADNVSWETEAMEQEFPYWDKATYEEQKEKALTYYAQKALAFPNRVVHLSRVSLVDLEEGDPTPTTLRKSDDPSYIYDGFPEAWER